MAVNFPTPSLSTRPVGPHRTPTAPEIAAALQRVSILDHRRQDAVEEISEQVRTDGLGRPRADSNTAASPSRRLSTAIRQSVPSAARWRVYLMQEVVGDRYLEAQLLLMTIATGCLDVMTFTTYRVFTSKQTGNTLFLATYALDRNALDPGFELNVGVSMSMFLAGAIIFGHVGHYSNQRRRIWLLFSSLFQLLLILAAAAIRYFVSREPTGHGALGVLALLAFAMSGQISTALHVKMPDVNTTMITGALISLCTERNIFKSRAPRRDRLLAFFLSMVVGCFLGATILRFSTPSAALATVAGTKGFITLSFLLNRGVLWRKFPDEEENGNRQDGVIAGGGAMTPVSRVLWGD